MFYTILYVVILFLFVVMLEDNVSVITAFYQCHELTPILLRGNEGIMGLNM